MADLARSAYVDGDHKENRRTLSILWFLGTNNIDVLEEIASWLRN